MLTELINTVNDLAAAPSPAPTEGGTVVDSPGIVGWFASVLVPILLAWLGVIILLRARGGQVSQTVTSSGIALVGIAFVGGAGVLMAFGDDIINLILK